MDREVICRLKIVGLLSIVLCLCLLLMAPFAQAEQLKVAEAEAGEAIVTGEISRKEFVNPKSGLFTSTDAEYRLYIEYTWTYQDEEITSEKYFSVPLDVYNTYNIGDVFDSTNISY